MLFLKDKIDSGLDIYCNNYLKNNQLRAENISLKEFAKYTHIQRR